MKKSEHNLKDLQDNIKGANICIKGFQKGKKEKKVGESLLEKIMAESL